MDRPTALRPMAAVGVPEHVRRDFGDEDLAATPGGSADRALGGRR